MLRSALSFLLMCGPLRCCVRAGGHKICFTQKPICCGSGHPRRLIPDVAWGTWVLGNLTRRAKRNSIIMTASASGYFGNQWWFRSCDGPPVDSGGWDLSDGSFGWFGRDSESCVTSPEVLPLQIPHLKWVAVRSTAASSVLALQDFVCFLGAQLVE